MEEACARAAVALYDRIPKGGKPSGNQEFTVMAAVMAVIDGSEPIVLSLSTGTKCAGVGVVNDKDCEEGSIVCDQHAETLAKRGFCRYLFKCILRRLRGLDSADGICGSIFEMNSDAIYFVSGMSKSTTQQSK